MECENSKLSQTPNLKRSAGSSPSPRPDSTSTCTADTDSAGLDRYRRSGRSPEERRQHALVACRNRRGAESGLIQDLGRALPISVVVLKSCDKLAILRLATSYLKLRALLERLEGSGGYDGEDAAEMEALLLGKGFVLIMTTDGEIVYVSENGAQGLHCETHAILGTNIYDHVDEDDHLELDRLLAVTVEELSRMTPTGSGTGYKTQQATATVHMRPSSESVSTSPTRPPPKRRGLEPERVRQTSAGQVRITGKVFLSSGRLKARRNFFVGVAEPLDFTLSATPHLLDPSACEFPFSHFEVSLILDWVCTADMKVVSFDLKKGVPSPDHNQDDMTGVSVFEFIHAEDLAGLRDGLKSMYKHGSLQTRQAYRMLGRSGGWAWFMTQASTMEVEDQSGGSRKEKGKSTTTTTFCIGRHFMISDMFQPGQPMATIQMRLDGAARVEESELSPDPVLALAPEAEAADTDGDVLADCDLLDLEFLDCDQFEDLQAEGACLSLSPFTSDGGDGFSGSGQGADVDWLLEELEALKEVPSAPAPSKEGGELCPGPEANPSAERSPLLRFLLEPTPSSLKF